VPRLATEAFFPWIGRRVSSLIGVLLGMTTGTLPMKQQVQHKAWNGRSWMRMALAFFLAVVIMHSAKVHPGSALLGRDSQNGITKAAGGVLNAAFGGPDRSGKSPHLIGFYAEQSMEAKRMRYLGGLLEQELPDVKIVWLETWENPLNERLRATIDNRNQCGGVPYLFNRQTGKVLCGVVAYDKLRLWATGKGGDPRIYRDIGGSSAGDD